MRDDIDPNSVVRVHLVGLCEWQHANGTIVKAADYDGFRAQTPARERRLFLSLQPGDLSVDWLDVTDHVANFMVINKDGVATRLAQKLGLSQSPGKDVMKKFAARTRELLKGRTIDQAAMMAAQEIFPAEFRPNVYGGVNHAMDPLLLEIDKL
jgi:hypothetical protein